MLRSSGALLLLEFVLARRRAWPAPGARRDCVAPPEKIGTLRVRPTRARVGSRCRTRCSRSSSVVVDVAPGARACRSCRRRTASGSGRRARCRRRPRPTCTCNSLRLQRRVVVDRRLRPSVGVACSAGSCRLEVFRQALEVGDRLAGDFGQRLVGVLERVARDDRVGARAVVLRARFVHVGDRRQAHFQALAGEVELLLQRGLRGFGGGQRFDLHQHVEVGRRGARDQRVAGRLQLEVAGLAQRVGAAQAREVAWS